MGFRTIGLIVGALFVAAAMALSFAPGTNAAGGALAARFRAEYRPPTAVPYPETNQHTAARERLGRTLFFDPRLSASGAMSCATCHHPGLAWSDGLDKGVGHGAQTLGRRTPTLLNLAWSSSLFWDGRSPSLESQALGPISSTAEMNMPLDRLVERLRGIDGYALLFAKAYPGEAISEETVGKAIATFERGIISAPAAFDKWLEGDEGAIPPAAQRGFALFNGKAECHLCHNGWRFTDDSFHDIGIPGDDRGRGALLPGIDAVQYAFKTPTLRNVARRAPYFHDGSAETLEEVMDLYDRGGIVKRPSLSADINPLRLTPQEKQDVIAFLHTLTSESAPVSVPPLPR
jgi:cytochrome c peroxidase